MQSQKQLDEYRRMTPGERLRLTFELIEAGWPYLSIGTEEQVRRKRERIQKDNELVNRRLLEAFARSKKGDH